MIRSILLATLLLFSGVAFAQQATHNPCANIPEATRNMNQQEVTTLLETCRAPAATVVEQLTNPETANKWSDAAKGFAEAIGIAAKELGIAANDFLDSPAGYLLAFILLFNYGGGMVIGVPMSVFTILLWWTTVKRVMRGTIEYQMVPVFWGAFTMRRVSKMTTQSSEEWGVYAVLSGICLLLLNLIIWVNVT